MRTYIEFLCQKHKKICIEKQDTIYLAKPYMYSSVVLEKNIDVNEHFYLLILCLYKYLVRE